MPLNCNEVWLLLGLVRVLQMFGFCLSLKISHPSHYLPVKTADQRIMSYLQCIALFAGTRFTNPMLLAMVEHSRSEALDFFTNRQPNPDGFSPKILKKEQIRKSGRKSDRPKVSISFGPNAQASSNTCHPFSCATFIHI